MLSQRTNKQPGTPGTQQTGGEYSLIARSSRPGRSSPHRWKTKMNTVSIVFFGLIYITLFVFNLIFLVIFRKDLCVSDLKILTPVGVASIGFLFVLFDSEPHEANLFLNWYAWAGILIVIGWSFANMLTWRKLRNKKTLSKLESPYFSILEE